MKIINRTMKGMIALATAVAAFGLMSPEVKELGGFGSTRNTWRTSMKPKGSTARIKRAARRNRNIRARSAK